MVQEAQRIHEKALQGKIAQLRAAAIDGSREFYHLAKQCRTRLICHLQPQPSHPDTLGTLSNFSGNPPWDSD